MLRRQGNGRPPMNFLGSPPTRGILRPLRTNGNIGVGTGDNEPEATLDVRSGGDGRGIPQVQIVQTESGGVARIRFRVSLAAGEWAAPSDIDVGLGRLDVSIEGQHVLTLTTRGDVGIGTEDPRSTLDVRGSLAVEDLNVAGTTSTGILEITGGSDLAERVAVSGEEDIRPGAVLVIDERNPGLLRLSDTPYDRRVAGVVSGAGGLGPGMTLMGELGDGRRKTVALAGRVFCQAVAPIELGDLLTTSDVVGHAMKVTTECSAQGAILGKAMTRLEHGSGLVLALVSLQ